MSNVNHTEGNHISRVAGATLTDKEYFIVKENASQQAILAAADTDKITGVIAKGNASGGAVDIVARNAHGTFLVVAGAAISKDDYLTADATGRAVATTGAGKEVFGLAMGAAAGAGEIIEYMACAFRY